MKFITALAAIGLIVGVGNLLGLWAVPGGVVLLLCVPLAAVVWLALIAVAVAVTVTARRAKRDSIPFTTAMARIQGELDAQRLASIQARQRANRAKPRQ